MKQKRPSSIDAVFQNANKTLCWGKNTLFFANRWYLLKIRAVLAAVFPSRRFVSGGVGSVKCHCVCKPALRLRNLRTEQYGF